MTTGQHQTLLSGLTLLWEPDRWVRQVSERVRFEDGDLVRDVTISYVLPDDNLSAVDLVQVVAVETTDAAEVAVLIEQMELGTVTLSDRPTEYYLPLLREPQKQTLVDISDLRLADGGRISMLAHEEHLAVSAEMLEARVIQVLGPHLLLTNPEHVEAMFDEFERLVATPPDQAELIFRRIFDEKSRQLRNYRSDARPADEARLYLLCRMLASRYPLLARVDANPGDEVTVSYTLRERHFENQVGFLKTVRAGLGAIPARLKVPLPLARRTHDYRFHIESPRGLYFYRSTLTEPKDRSAGRAISGGNLYVAANGTGFQTPSLTRRPSGGATEISHLHGGPNVDHRLAFELQLFEIPPGATLFAWVVAVLSTSICSGVGALVAWTRLDGAYDSAALIVAIAAAAPIVAGPFLPRSDMFDSPLLARACLFASGVLAALFAIWILSHNAKAQPGEAIPDIVRWYASWAAWIVLALQMLIVAALSWRFVRSVSSFRRARAGQT